MASLLSPGIQVVEKDFSQIIPSVSSSVGGMVGRFTKGPVNVPVLINSEQSLIATFGLPNDENANDWFTVANFLQYTNACWVVRSANIGMFNANTGGITGTGVGVAVINRDGYDTYITTPNAAAGEFIAKDSGTTGNGIQVILVDFDSWTAFSAANPALAGNFRGQPTTTAYTAKTAGGIAKNDELHILVIDGNGFITGTPGTVLEKFEGVSKLSDAVNFQGLSIYYVNVINESSNYIWWNKHPTTNVGGNFVAWGSTDEVANATTLLSVAKINIIATPFYYTQTMSGGATGTAGTTTLANIQAAYDKLGNKDLYSVDLLMTGAFSVGLAGDVEKYAMQTIVANRGDCVGFISPHNLGSPIKDGTVAFAQTTTLASISYFKSTSVGIDSVNTSLGSLLGSYGFMDTGMKYMYDRYSYKYRWVPLNGDMAGLAARTDNTNDPWWSFGGYNRGGVKGVIKLAYNPSSADRDNLYPKGINPVIIDPSSGPILLGDRTMTTKPSAFDRINVRRLFIVLEKAIAKSARYMLFEFNDNFTRSQFKNMTEPFLKTIQGKRGITDFYVRCDATNNTGQIIDANQFVAEIYIKPARSINFITLNFVATRSDVSFSTVVGA